jgi:hypothetical protein
MPSEDQLEGLSAKEAARWHTKMLEPLSVISPELDKTVLDELFNAIEQVASGAAFRYSVPGVFVVSIQPDKNGQVWVENLKTCKQYQVVPV